MGKEIYLKSGFAKIEHDLHFLMECFEEVLKDAGETLLCRCLPWIGNPKNAAKVIPPDQLCQTYSIAFQLLNIVEENTAAQVRRQRETQLGSAAEHGLWGYHLHRLKKAGVSAEKIAASLPHIQVEPVLTAHPTEAKRPVVLQHHRQLYLLLVQRENQMWTPAEQNAIREKIKVELERLWRTGEIYLRKPEVATERQSVIHYLREVFPSVLSKLDLRLRQAWEEAQFPLHLLSHPDALPLIKFGTWVGGDRDGHPLVTEQTTQDTLLELRSNALSILQDLLHGLPQKLSLSQHWQPAPKNLLRILNERISLLDPSTQKQLAQFSEEPWKQFACLLIKKLPLQDLNSFSSKENSPTLSTSTYRTAAELEQDLRLLRQSLIEANVSRIAIADIDPILRHIRTFGFHLATLDVRQNSKFHDAAVDQLLRKTGAILNHQPHFAEWTEKDRLELLNRELLSSRPLISNDTPIGPEADAVLKCYRVLAQYLQQYGAEGLGALIVSMTRELSDLLLVYLLAREGGIAFCSDHNALVCPLPIVPLFETVEDLEHSPAILSQFLEHPITQASLRLQCKGDKSPTLQIMIGYSDSNKDRGILASQWALYRAQKSMTTIAHHSNISLRFFHGRGGTISRGAGPTHRFLEALPHGSLTGDLRVTEQGETIAQKYANWITATYNLELLLASTTGETLLGAKRQLQQEEIDPILNLLAQESATAYQALLSEENFMEFYTQATPIDVLERSSIGSRPSRRSSSHTLSDLRAIPWVFSWNQSRFYLPGWFGVGTALEKLHEQNPKAFQQLKKLVLVHPLLCYTLTNVETNLASAHLGIMQNYADLVENITIQNHFMKLISSEFKRSQRMIEKILGSALAKRRPRMLRTLALREEALALLHSEQLHLLKTWRNFLKEGKNSAAEKIFPEVLLSVNAIAGGLRTTG